MTNEIRHQVTNVKKLNNVQLFKLYVKVTGRTSFCGHEIVTEADMEAERDGMLVVVGLYGPNQVEETEETLEADRERNKEVRERLVKLQLAEKYAAVPGWKRDWIRRLRYNGRGASWNEIATLTGVHTNMCSNIVKGKIYKWDTDCSAKINGVSEKTDFAGMMAAVGLVKHEERDLDRFFAVTE